MLKIVFEDEQILIIDKPPNLVVDRSSSNQDQTMEDILKTEHGINLERSGIVHRLDKDTSGLMVVAKTETALEDLKAQFKNRTTHKEYLCLVHGLIDQPGRIEAAIKRNPDNNERFIVSVDGKEAVTEYYPIEKIQVPNEKFQTIFNAINQKEVKKMQQMGYGKFTKLLCKPITGRTHQIRVHLKHLGFPIVADERYGGRKTVRVDRLWCPRQFLHAQKLTLIHPQTKQQLEFESQLPDDLISVWNQLQTSLSNSPSS